MNSNKIPNQFLTWIDVQRAFKSITSLWSNTPDFIENIDCYSDGVDITHNTNDDNVKRWLSDHFGVKFNPESCNFELKIDNSQYQVNLISNLENTLKRNSPPIYPLWQDVTYIDDTSTAPINSSINNWDNSPRITTFHSFKGGVGRTTTLMSYVTASLDATLNNSIKKILIIDADLEAPGVTFWLDDANKPDVSFIQFIESCQYPSISIESTIAFFAQELRKTSISFDGGQKEVFVLPSMTSLFDIEDMVIKPSDISRNPENPWQLSDYIKQLAIALNVELVFIDLRAGLSEISSPLLFDPRIEHFFVSTIASQSVIGISEILKQLYKFNKKLSSSETIPIKPTVILSLLTPQLKKLPEYTKAIEAIGSAYPSLNIEDQTTSGIDWKELEFSEVLMSISNMSQGFDLLRSSSVYSDALEWCSSVSEPPKSLLSQEEQINDPTKNNDELDRLNKICKELQFAEANYTEKMLITDPLRNLGKHFCSEIPNAVIVGAKGSGKTFTYLQIAKSKDWSAFLSKLNSKWAENYNTPIFPFLFSDNIDNRHEIASIREASLEKAKLSTTLNLVDSEFRRSLTNALKDTNTYWDDFWTTQISKYFGASKNNLQEINDKLIGNNTSLTLIFDGIEDIFSMENPVDREAVSALLKLPNRLNELRNRRIGCLVLIRLDYLQSAIKQNVGQFLSRYSAFQLHWNPESFLRLAYWLCGQAHIIGADAESAEQLPLSDLLKTLERLWGKKLGSNTSKEAHSVRWVYAALCDLRGSFQARDLVRFVRFAAEIEKNAQSNNYWNDRLISPESMRKSIPKCSKEKVEEAITEIAPLKTWLKRLNELGITDRKAPFSAPEMKLTTEESTALQQLGVIYEDTNANLGEERFYLPEIYRTGLGFETSVSGRPRTQALLKKNLGSIPF